MTDALFGKAYVLMASHKFVDAISAYHETLQIDSKNTQALERKVSVLVSLEEYQRSIDECFDPLIKDHPTNLDYLHVKSVSLRKMNRFEEAIIVLDKMLSMDADGIDAYNNKGGCLLNLGKGQIAIDECFDEVLSIDATNIRALQNKGAALYQLGKYEESMI